MRSDRRHGYARQEDDVCRHPHPGETPDETSNDPAKPKAFSSWPDGDTGKRPRSACVVITKDDGGEIGS
jgi:secreted PhoX family phosphatase